MTPKEIEKMFSNYICWAVDVHGNQISVPVTLKWINKREKRFSLVAKL